MRNLKLTLVCTALFLTGIIVPETLLRNRVAAQGQTAAQDRAASLRSQLIEVETKQSELQTRLQKLEENLKSENIEHSLAGVGSTRPEDLREQRRRQLEIERNGVQAQLNLLAASHTRLETAIAQADADAYRLSAAPVTATTTPTGASIGGPSSEPAIEVTTPKRPRRTGKKRTRKSRKTHHAQSFGVRRLDAASHDRLEAGPARRSDRDETVSAT